MAWEFSNEKPIYLQLSDQIVSGILTGIYPKGEKLPSVREFALIAAVNPNTVSRALAELEGAGLIETQRNTGKYVTQEGERIEMARKKRGALLAADFLKSMAALGYSKAQTIELAEQVWEEVQADERDKS